MNGSSRANNKSRRSGRRQRFLRAKTDGPIGRFLFSFIDPSTRDVFIKNLQRVAGSKRKLCYTTEEIRYCERNMYYRSMIIGSALGSTIYLALLILTILPTNKTLTPMDAVVESDHAGHFLAIFSLVTLLVLIVRFMEVAYLNAYVILVGQIATLTLAALGSYQYRCSGSNSDIYSDNRNTTEELKPRLTGRDPLSSGGHLPLFVMGLFERAFGSNYTDLRDQIYANRCDQAVVRACAVNTLSECINVAYAILIMWNA